jgi:hypothetical protein
MFPVKPVSANLKTYSANPSLITQSPSQKWLLIQNNQSSTQTAVFDQYDTTTLDQTSPAVTQVSIPANVLTNYSTDSKLTEVEWSTDNNNVLLQHSYSGGSEFIVFDRDLPSQSFNVNKLFNFTPTQVSLYNKKADQLYLYSDSDGSLRLGNVNAPTLAAPILKNVLAYKPYGRDLITYVTASGEPEGLAAARIWENGQTYKLNEFSTGGKYLIEAAQFQGNFYYASGSDVSDRINIYKNQSYQYPITEPLADGMVWMDGHRFIGESEGKVFVMDYDGTNRQLLTATNLPAGALFNANFRHMLTTVPATDGSSVIFQDVDMRAGADLPKK